MDMTILCPSNYFLHPTQPLITIILFLCYEIKQHTLKTGEKAKTYNMITYGMQFIKFSVLWLQKVHVFNCHEEVGIQIKIDLILDESSH